MSPLILFAFVVFVLFVLVLAVVRGSRRQRASVGGDVPDRGAMRAPQPGSCPSCGGFGYTMRPQSIMETKFETSTEFYTDFSGRRGSRSVTRPRSVTRFVNGARAVWVLRGQRTAVVSLPCH